jgi:predicted transglutaminase-like cysteine proteinase
VGTSVSSAIIRAICATVLTLGSIHVGKTQVLSAAPTATVATVGEIISAPYGWIEFCSRQPQECDQPVLAAVDLDITTQAWETVNQINQQVNAAIKPVSNLEHWGTIADPWDYRYDGKGDCKIDALQKRNLLIEKGFPRQALLMTIVRDQNNQGHAILAVKTNRGDSVLDNLTPSKTP